MYQIDRLRKHDVKSGRFYLVEGLRQKYQVKLT
jgi:hypothetical protein